MGEALDFLKSIGITDGGLIFAVILATNFIKGYDKTGKFSRFYPVLVLILGAGAGYLATPTDLFKDIARNGSVYAVVALVLYTMFKDTKLMQLFSRKTEAVPSTPATPPSSSPSDEANQAGGVGVAPSQK